MILALARSRRIFITAEPMGAMLGAEVAWSDRFRPTLLPNDLWNGILAKHAAVA